MAESTSLGASAPMSSASIAGSDNAVGMSSGKGEASRETAVASEAGRLSTPPPADGEATSPRPKEARRRRHAGGGGGGGNYPRLPAVQGGDRRHNLMQSLSHQLDYYFSDANLSRDTFLKTIMSHNSGYVPTSVLANFANVNRIIGQYDPYGDLLAAEGAGVPGLVKEAAGLSGKLEVVALSREGKVVGDGAAVDGTTLAGVGNRGGGGGGGGGGAKVSTIAKTSPVQTQQKQVQPPLSPTPKKQSTEPERSTIILRDAPASATEEDVRSVFSSLVESSKCPPVHSVHSDVANCWFVTLEPTTKDELVTILLALRNKSIRGQPVKARLKTESHVKSYYIETTSSAPTSPVAGNRFGGGRRPYMGGGGAAAARQVYSGDRAGVNSYGGASQAKQSQSVPNSPMVSDGHRKGRQPPAHNGGTPGAHERNGKGTPFGAKNRGGRGSGRGNGAEGGSPAPVRRVRDMRSIPMPPLLDTHFPALGGGSDGSDKDVTPPSSPARRASGGTGSGEKGAVKDETVQAKKVPPAKVPETPSKDEGIVNKSSSDAKKPMGGYAAALMKAAPPTPPPSKPSSGRSSPVIDNHKSHKASKGKEAKNVAVGDKGPPSKASATATTVSDDMSADDKSSVSSKPESDKGAPVAIATPAWGMGRSFADVLKKKQEAGQADDKSSTN